MSETEKSREQEPRDFYSEGLEYKMTIGSENAEDFPKVTPEDIRKHREKFVALFGRWKVNGDKVILRVEGTVGSDGPPIVFSVEDKIAVDYGELRKFFEKAKATNPAMSDMDIIGEVHTHPYKNREECGGVDPWLPSPTDIKETIKAHSFGLIPNDKPFVFGVSSIGEDGKQNLAFYRIVRGPDGDLSPRAFNDWEWEE